MPLRIRSIDPLRSSDTHNAREHRAPQRLRDKSPAWLGGILAMLVPDDDGFGRLPLPPEIIHEMAEAFMHEVYAMSWSREEQQHLDDAFQDRFLFFFSNFRVQAYEKVGFERISKVDGSGKLVWTNEPILLQPLTPLTPVALANRFITSVRNKIRDWIGRDARTQGPDEIEQHKAPDDDKDFESMADRLRAWAEAEIGVGNQRDAFVSIVIEGEQVQAVAERLDVPRGTVSSWNHRNLKKATAHFQREATEAAGK